MDFVGITTTALIDLVKKDPNASEREIALVDRLLGAIDEVNALTAELGRAAVPERERADA